MKDTMKKIVISILALVGVVAGVRALNVSKDQVNIQYLAPADMAGEEVAMSYDTQMEYAEQATEAGQVSVALTHYILAAEIESAGTLAYEKAVVLLEQNQPSLLRDDKHAVAEGYLILLRNSVQEKGTNVYQQNGSFVPYGEVLKDIDVLTERIKEHVTLLAGARIAAARAHGKVAKRWYWFNDRTEVVAGLKDLYWVYERGQFLNHHTIGDYNAALAYLNKRVSDGELTELKSQAGFVESFDAKL